MMVIFGGNETVFKSVRFQEKVGEEFGYNLKM